MADVYGDSGLRREDATLDRNLYLVTLKYLGYLTIYIKYHGTLPVLSPKHTTLAEFAQTQSFLQRLFC